MKFLILNGPNLNLLGLREPDIYGRQTYQDLADRIRAEVELGDGRRVACDVDYSRPEGSKRPIGYSLTVTPDCPLPLGQAILTLRWIDGSGLARERKLIVNVTIEGDGEEVTD